MSVAPTATARARLGQALTFLRASEPRAPLTRRSAVADIALAAVFMGASLTVILATGAGVAYAKPAGRLTGQLVLVPEPRIVWAVVMAACLIAAPLAVRRRYPLAALAVLLAMALATRRYTTDVTFLAIVVAGYSAVAHSRFRGAALLAGPFAGVIVSYSYWEFSDGGVQVLPLPVGLVRGMVLTRPLPPVAIIKDIKDMPVAASAVLGPAGAPWRVTALVTMVALISITVVGSAMHAAQSQARVARLQAEHEAATRRAVRVERARIASELHDVVTHNVAVMIVQAGAARQVLAASPAQATDALLAVESSGRAAMAELRHLLGLLSPPDPAADGGADGGREGRDLRPQPGLGQLQPLVDRVSRAGLPVRLTVGELVPDMPAGVDLAAYRVVQEALTNVIKHAGKPPTSVDVACRDGRLVVEVADDGAPIPAAAPRPAVGGRGLLGLRERVALYGGELQAGPRPEGGWLLRASIPARPPSGPPPSPVPSAWPGSAPLADRAPRPGPAAAPAPTWTGPR